MGIIPARAGFTWAASGTSFRGPDHPRSRGVYCEYGHSGLADEGSSPLARGLLRGLPDLRRGRGIIPARAGFTRSTPGSPRRPRDHPRSRGVYPRLALARRSRPGSSPLARGLHRRGHRRCARPRIIPARAGFTHRHDPGAAQPDHPRSRGVYASFPFSPAAVQGSSPLARGLRRLRPRLRVSGGIIPARAGFTPCVLRRESFHRDHPRSRGVYVCTVSCNPDKPGSSPLARGLHARTTHLVTIVRIIPARAGFTG